MLGLVYAGYLTYEVIPFKLAGPPTPRDTEASNAYAVMHDSLGPVCMCSLIGINSFVHWAEGDPDPGIPVDFSQFLQRGQVAFLLVDERPQLIQLALVQV